jgi:hypothetical protein
MARKRSLKDAAADQLVEKNKTVPKTPVAPAERPAAASSAVQTTRAEPVEESAGRPLHAAEASQAPASPAKEVPAALKRAILIAIGFAAGVFFGMGQAIGPANMAYLLIGFVGGCFFGRLAKIF